MKKQRVKLYFKTWLKKQHKRNDMVGDLARDYIADMKLLSPIGKHIPNSLICWAEYLEDRNACSAALNALTNAWAEYKNHLKAIYPTP